MLSILIPTYNYNVYPLVLELHKQCLDCGIEFEILCQDDASHLDLNFENEKINSISYCSYSNNLQNLGRGKNINILCTKSKHEYVLIMEADSFPKNKLFIKEYLNHISNSTTAIFGGVKYPTTIPPNEKLLRWKYGHSRESKSLENRLKNRYSFIFTWNLLLKKDILLKHPFPEFISEYGYEDTIFIKKLLLNSISITHIENNLIHYNNEDSIDFIKKTEKALKNLNALIHLKKIDPKDIRLTSVFINLKKLHLIGLVKTIFILTKEEIVKNLTSKSCSLFLFDFYKLGYYCNIQSK